MKEISISPGEAAKRDNLGTDKFKSNELFNNSDSNQKLQLTARFESDTAKIIQEVSDSQGLSQAEVIRRLVRSSLEKR